MLAFAVAFESFQPISRRNSQIKQPLNGIEQNQFAAGSAIDLRKQLRWLIGEHLLGFVGPEGLYHVLSLTHTIKETLNGGECMHSPHGAFYSPEWAVVGAGSR